MTKEFYNSMINLVNYLGFPWLPIYNNQIERVTIGFQVRVSSLIPAFDDAIGDWNNGIDRQFFSNGYIYRFYCPRSMQGDCISCLEIENYDIR